MNIYPNLTKENMETKVKTVMLDVNNKPIAKTDVRCNFYQATVAARIPHTQAAHVYERLQESGTTITRYGDVFMKIRKL